MHNGCWSPSKLAYSIFVLYTSPKQIYSLPCLLRRRVLSTQSFRVMEKKAMPKATLQMYIRSCVLLEWVWSAIEGLTRAQ